MDKKLGLIESRGCHFSQTSSLRFAVCLVELLSACIITSNLVKRYIARYQICGRLGASYAPA
ncbi:hypothetical protein SAMN05421882_10434 [Nitrosomonas communis]|uniref:Uncharacterized protein n=1 Tax=Nitrosomonas communis TaxID=44574 RepID=A0A1H2XUG0_9PROT|nr:hypothetical protein SAMN05421882_10434 [Nitrosomonas communis]